MPPLLANQRSASSAGRVKVPYGLRPYSRASAIQRSHHCSSRYGVGDPGSQLRPWASTGFQAETSGLLKRGMRGPRQRLSA
ncbi:hypothetical protein ACNF49_23805 [Actinomadura sp. ATCC 39365]